jgi:hypothetical protein
MSDGGLPSVYRAGRSTHACAGVRLATQAGHDDEYLYEYDWTEAKDTGSPLPIADHL